MPLQLVWINEPAVAEFIFSGDVTAHDLDEFGRLGIDLAGRGPLSALVDFSAAKSLPKNLVNTALRSSPLLEFASHPHARRFVFVDVNPAARFMVEMVFRNTAVKIAQTRETAIAYLKDATNDSDD